MTRNMACRSCLMSGVGQVWITVIVAVLAATMSESAIDSLQNAIVDNISGSFLKGLPLIWIRVLVIILSVPVIIVSLQVTLLTSICHCYCYILSLPRAKVCLHRSCI